MDSMQKNTKTSPTYYQQTQKLLVAVDCIIFGFDGEQLKLLVFKRKLEPFLDYYSLIGSFVHPNESTMEAARRVLYDFTGLEAIYLKELKVYSAIDRDPGARCISIAKYALIRVNDYHKALSATYDTEWVSLDKLPQLVMDHNTMVTDAFQRLKRKAQLYPIGFELLPKKFTVPMLQRLYEELFERSFDTRNFRKKLLSLNLVKQLPEKDKSTSKKGSFLYQFDYKKYKRLSQKGFQFSLFKI